MPSKKDKIEKEGPSMEDLERVTGPPMESLDTIEGEVAAKKGAEEPKPGEEKPKRRRRKKKPEPEPEAGPIIEPELMNYFILAITGFFASFLGPKWIAQPQELPMLSKATDRWVTAKFPALMEKHSEDVEMVTVWGLYTLNRISFPIPTEEKAEEALDKAKETDAK